ncbi:phosphate signaling complex PhoU family protein [Methanobacterium alcaliphilum]|uniref:phosphate signaling complex PhoU family protein n=1 Tax=Methanobacterium alcaliphilum TaxID=392018 RepID=UPI002009F662|nr:phosphate uptake regulator PhoU [Methanobacterium alcaliphilum]MCK9152158.1 phosphate uptake regulator PhoU [Methanobacterium alcaliphilum]
MIGVILENKLSALSQEVLGYSEQTADRINDSVNSFLDGDLGKARNIIELTATVNEKSHKIEHECLKILGLHQPVAKDLRMGAAVLRTSIELERINILAAYIARYAIDANQNSRNPYKPPHLNFMSQSVQGMLKDAMGALISQDIQLLKRSTKNYVTIQDFYNQMFAQYDDDSLASSSTYLMLVGRNLLSMGHHVMGMADRIAYMIVGKRVMHHKVFYNVLMR